MSESGATALRLPHRINRVAVAFCHDILMAAISFPLALFLRLGDRFHQHAIPYFELSLAVFVAVFALAAVLGKLERSVWRYVSLRELKLIVQVSAATIVVFYAGLFALSRLEGIPRSVPAVHGLVLLALLTGPRALYRGLRDREGQQAGETAAIPVLLIGSGAHAEQFLRALQRMPGAPYRVVAMLDEQPGQQGRTLHGVPILGGLEGLEPSLVRLTRENARPQRVLLSEGYLDAPTIERVMDFSERHGIPLARLPRLTEFQEGVSGQVTLNPLRIEDLLGRSQNVHDKSAMARLVAGKRVLVTGAGGSIGSELCRQIAALGPEALILYDSSEYNLYEIDHELGETHAALPRTPVIGDVRDERHMAQLFTIVRPQIVYHAAAIKHVPLAEANVVETLLTNVLGSGNVARAAAAAGAEAFVLISTDKAVNPANVMGAAKRLAERVVASVSANGEMRVTTVRFGNVLGSRGSVVPLFQRQLASGGPITVTHPDIERYFMTIREAVELVLESSAIHAEQVPEKTRIFVLDMGAPVKIDALARQMIRLAGLKPDIDVKIAYSGLRPGEKMYEELFYDTETLDPTSHSSVRLAKLSEGAVPSDFAAGLAALESACEMRDEAAARAALVALVPEYRPVDSLLPP